MCLYLHSYKLFKLIFSYLLTDQVMVCVKYSAVQSVVVVAVLFYFILTLALYYLCLVFENQNNGVPL